MKSKKIIAVWFSCGAASAVAAALTLKKYGRRYDVRLLNNPVKEEDSDNIRFKRDVEKWLGVKIEKVVNHNYKSCSAVDVWNKRAYMSGNAGAPCTLELKKMARQQYEMDHDIAFHVLGFTSEEVKRFENFKNNERPNSLPILIDAGMTKEDCYKFLQDAGIKPPRMYKLGYPNANCIGCVKASSPTYWNHVRKVHPDIFEARAKQSREIGAKLVRHKGKRIYLDKLPKNAKGRSMRNLNFECGIFCHTGGSDE